MFTLQTVNRIRRFMNLTSISLRVCYWQPYQWPRRRRQRQKLNKPISLTAVNWLLWHECEWRVYGHFLITTNASHGTLIAIQQDVVLRDANFLCFVKTRAQTHASHAKLRRAAFHVHSLLRSRAAIPEIGAFENYYYTCSDNWCKRSANLVFFSFLFHF